MDSCTTEKAPESIGQAFMESGGPLNFQGPRSHLDREDTEKKELTGETWSFAWTRGNNN